MTAAITIHLGSLMLGWMLGVAFVAVVAMMAAAVDADRRARERRDR